MAYSLGQRELPASKRAEINRRKKKSRIRKMRQLMKNIDFIPLWNRWKGYS